MSKIRTRKPDPAAIVVAVVVLGVVVISLIGNAVHAIARWIADTYAAVHAQLSTAAKPVLVALVVGFVLGMVVASALKGLERDRGSSATGSSPRRIW